MISMCLLEDPLLFFMILPNIFFVFLLESLKLKIFLSFVLLLEFLFILFKKVGEIDIWLFLLILIYSVWKLKFTIQAIPNHKRNWVYQQSVDLFPQEKIENIELDILEEEIYRKYFIQIFSQNDFKNFFSIAQKKNYKKKINLSREGLLFDKIYFFAKIPLSNNIVLRNRDIAISYLEEGSWAGIIEFILYYTDTHYNRWLVDLHLHSDKHTEVIVYEWDVVSLYNLFLHSMDFEMICKISLLWLKYLSHCTSRLDSHIADALKAIVYKDKSSRSLSIPVCK
jgi:hypothetical protein